jgi:hypothetical protein
MLEAIHARGDHEAATKKAGAVVEKPRRMKLGKAADQGERTIPETLTDMHHPREHWRSIRTNTPLERLMREIILIAKTLCRNRILGAIGFGFALEMRFGSGWAISALLLGYGSRSTPSSRLELAHPDLEISANPFGNQYRCTSRGAIWPRRLILSEAPGRIRRSALPAGVQKKLNTLPDAVMLV